MFFLLDRMFLLSFFVVGPETEGGRESPCAAESLPSMFVVCFGGLNDTHTHTSISRSLLYVFYLFDLGVVTV